MPSAFVIVLDSVGIGSAPDAAAYGDAGANTVGHIAERCARGQVTRAREHERLLVLLERAIEVHLPACLGRGIEDRLDRRERSHGQGSRRRETDRLEAGSDAIRPRPCWNQKPHTTHSTTTTT